MKIDGGCHCGAIAYEAEVDPASVVICHCTDCQMMGGGTYRTNIPAAAGGFRLMRGTPKTYVKTAESGNKRVQAFCADCGTGLWATSPGTPEWYGLRVGPIAQRAAFRPAKQIWCRSVLPWTKEVLNVPGHPGQ